MAVVRFGVRPRLGLRPSQLRAHKFNFSPISLPGLNLWLDASRPGTLWQDTGATTPAIANTDPIALWQDLSGSGNHVTSSGSNRPTLATAQFKGRNVVNFNRTAKQHVFKTSYNQNFTEMAIFIVLSHASTPADFDGVVSASPAVGSDFDNVNGFTLYFPAGTKPEFLQYASGGASYISLTGTTISPATSTPFVADMIADGGNASMNVNGVTGKTDTYSALNCTPATLAIGSRSDSGVASDPHFNGRIAEVLIFTTVPEAAVVSQIRSYLMSKWGIS